MRGLRIWINSILLLAPILFLGIGAIRLVRATFDFLNSHKRLAGTISAEATRALGRYVRVGDVHITGNLWSLSAANKVELFDVFVANGADRSTGAFAIAHRVTVWYNLQQVLGGDQLPAPIVDEVQFDTPQLLLSRSTIGRWNYEDLLRPPSGSKRSFTSKLSSNDGTLIYQDYDFPHPPGVPQRALNTRLQHLNGVVLLRPDKSIAFDLTGVAQPDYLRDFHAVGTAVTTPLDIQARLTARQVNLPEFARRLLPPGKTFITAGHADVNVGVEYAPPIGTPPRRLDTKALNVHGTVQVIDAAAQGAQLGGAVEHLNGTATFTTDSLVGDLNGIYNRIPVKLAGTLLGFTLPPLAQGQHSGPPPAPPVASAVGSVEGVNWTELSRLSIVQPLLSRIPTNVRTQLNRARAHGDVQFKLMGPINDPTISFAGRLSTLEYLTYRGDNVDLNGLYAARVLHLSASGKYAQGDVVVRAKAAFDPGGAFEAEGHARGVQLGLLGAPVPVKLSGIGQVDITIRGQRGRTPDITAQAQADNVSVNGQTIRAVYAQADTVGPDLVIRSLRAGDPKGFIVGSGTIGLKSRRLNIVVDADDLNFGAIATAYSVYSRDHSEPVDAGTEARSKSAFAEALDPAQIRGYGYLRGRMTGTFEDPKLSGSMYAFGLRTKKINLDKVALSSFEASKHEIIVHGVASRYPGGLTIDGSILRPFTRAPELNLDARAEKLDLSLIADLAGLDAKKVVLAGTLTTGTIPIRGTTAAVQIPAPVTVNLQYASINGLPIRNASLTARYQPEGIYIQNGSAQIADGLVLASGWVPFSGPINLTAVGSGIQLQTLEEAVYASVETPNQVFPTVKGDLAFRLRVSGTLSDPVINANSITAEGLKYNNFEIGSLTASAGYAGRRITVNDLVQQGPKPSSDVPAAGTPPAPDPGTITIRELSYDLDTKQIRTAPAAPVQFNNIRIERLIDLAFNVVDPDNESVRKVLNSLNDITGPLSVTAAIGGTLEQPTADIAWNSGKLNVKNYGINSFRGTAFVDKTKLIYPSPTLAAAGPDSDHHIHLDSDYAQLVSPSDPRIKNISIGFNSNGQEGKILTLDRSGKISDLPADITISNVDLTFLQKIFSKSYVAGIKGLGDIDITATGKTVSPSIRLSTNLHDLAYASAANPKAPLVELNRLALEDTTIEEGKISVGSLRAIKIDKSGKSYVAEINGELTGFSYQSPFFSDNARLNFGTLPGKNIPLEFVAGVVPNVLGRFSQGGITFHSVVTNLGKTPSVRGDVSVVAPQLQFGPLATGLQDLKATLALNNDRLTVVSFAGHSRVFDKTGKPKPKMVGSEIHLSGSLPLGLSGDPGGTGTGMTLTADAFDFDETPMPNTTRTGVARGSVNLNLRIVGTVKEPNLTGKAVLTDAVLTPPKEEKGPPPAFPIVPKFDLAIQLGRNVRLNSAQLDARLSTDHDIVARGNLLARTPDIHVEGTIQIPEGTLKLPVSKFAIQPGAFLKVTYPSYEGGEPVLGLTINIKAQGYIVATSLSGVRKRYQVTVSARGPLNGETVNPITGESNLVLDFETNPNDLAATRQQLAERLAGAIIGVDSLDQAGRNPGQTFANVLTGVFTGSVLPGIFDRTAASLGFEEFSLNYDPVQRLTLSISRHLFGPLYVSYYRTLTNNQEQYDLKLSFRFRDRYQISLDTDEQHTQKILLEGIWKF